MPIPSTPGGSDKSTIPPDRQKLDTQLNQLLDPSEIPAADAYDRFGIARQTGMAIRFTSLSSSRRDLR